jgi:lipid II:glycine glycyltransferase (peptidoglycan interpeptide bridge formation enzyme)
MKSIVTKEAIYQKKWDIFISQNENGSHLQSSEWLKSYKSYGFDYELFIIEDNEEIIGGFGAVIAKVLFFKFYILPYGPIVKLPNEDVLKHLLKVIPLRAKKLKCCYCQVSFPVFRVPNYILSYYKSLENCGYIEGNLFKYVYSSNGLNWLDFEKYTNVDAILLDFKSYVRRDIRSAERKETVIKFLTKEIDLKKAYDLCLENGKSNNYSLRDWSSFKTTILSLVESGTGKFIAAYNQNDLKGAIFIVKAGNYYTYILGGTKKEKPDLLVGHLLQWEAIKWSFLENCIGYNISLGGSPGVQEFKNNFVTQQYLNVNGKFYVILDKTIFNFFLFFEKKIKPYKTSIAKLLTVIKRK